MTRLERLKQLRDAVMLNTESLPDEQAAKIPTMFDAWEVGVAHTSQADWTPDATPALWAVIDATHAGTIEDPIPAARGMDYIYGKYYLDPEDQKTYKCERTGSSEGETINLQYLPHELIGHYFALAS